MFSPLRPSDLRLDASGANRPRRPFDCQASETWLT